MIRINLLPYRQARRRKQLLKQLSIFLAGIIAALILITGVHLYYSTILDTRQKTLVSLQAENRLLVKKIGKVRDFDKLKKDVEAKLRLVDRLQSSRFRSLGRLIALSEAIPNKVWLKTIIDKGNKIQLSGFAESNKVVANFMRGIDKDVLFSNVHLEVIRRVKFGSVPARKFTLSLIPLEHPGQKPHPPGEAS